MIAHGRLVWWPILVLVLHSSLVRWGHALTLRSLNKMSIFNILRSSAGEAYFAIADLVHRQLLSFALSPFSAPLLVHRHQLKRQ